MTHHRATTIESLESRRLLSGVFLGSLGTLRILGDNDVNDTIAVSPAGEQVQVIVNGGAAHLFDVNDVLRVVIRTGSGDDNISVIDFARPTWVFAEAGNDTVTTGGGRDVIYTHSGDDVIDTGDNHDWVVGGDGNDNISSGAGKDRVWGRDGNDTLLTGDGNDIAVGGRGDDLIETGVGTDRAYGRDGADTIRGGDGNDRLWGGPGNDSIEGNAGDDVLGGIFGNNTLLGGDGADTFVAQSLDLNVSNDFDPAIDILRTVDPNNEDVQAD